MYSVLDLVITGVLTLLSVIGSASVIATIDKPRAYVTTREGIRVLMIQIGIILWLLWFGFEGRTIGHGLMSVLTWSVVAWKLLSLFRTTGTIENPHYARVRSPRVMVMDSISTTVQTSGMALMFGLALAYGG